MLSFAGVSMAENQWQKNHPRRTQVNKRLHNQNKRINKELRQGKISRNQAKQLKKENRQIRRDERHMAKQHGGHITKEEQKALNQRENGVSNQIGK
ncbi:hypothetical protein [Candidatus Magnetominusculus dajiuhuensis]|uniref:hypothetical protein n=1 Tax=Candidatus Magnetominusculus dajiuhuensis TaxID=3137712 RepID=UPI003B428F00